MIDITVLIITKNAEKTLERTLGSVFGWASAILVIDDYSVDKTKKIARDYGCKVVNHQAINLGEQRQYALSQVETEWTLVLDSDEVLTPTNKSEIAIAIQNKKYDGYYLLFRNHLFGKKLQHGELHKKLVLFKTKSASISEKEVHEQYEVKGTVGELPSEVLHYSYRSVRQIASKFINYSWRQGREYKRINKKFGLKELFLNPLHMFYARFIGDKGYKDGAERIILDAAFALMEFFSYAFIPLVKTKKRISVDCGSYPVGGMVQSGIDRLLQGLYSHASHENDYFWFSFAKTSPNKLPTLFFSQLWLPLKIILNRCDIFIGTAGHIPFLLSFFPIKKILFLYDFGFFSSPEKYNLSAKKLQAQTINSIQSANIIVVLHQEIYKEFEKRYPQLIYKVVVIPAGADHLKKVKEESVLIQSHRPFILFVGVVKPVKRIDKILSVVGNIYCVIAGPHENKYIETLQIEKTQHIQFIKNFNDEQLKWLYKKASIMIYTSEHEGFCYPVLEALTLGLPVVALDLPLFHEYKKYFPHLTLVKSVEEMKKELIKFKEKPNMGSVDNPYPYSWEKFNNSLFSLVQLRQLTRLATKSTKRIVFICVLYKTPQDEKWRLEKEIKKMNLPHYIIHWVDNSTNGKGYAEGINEGIRRGLLESCDLFVALNPDVSLVNFTAETIVNVADEFDIWGFGMKQNNVTYYGGEVDKWRLSGGLTSMKPLHQFTAVDFVSGSVIGFTKQVVQKVGMWSEEYFMYYEDIDYCERARRAGFDVGIDSTIVYEHFETSQINKKKKKWLASSRWKYFWKYANLKQKVREIIRLPILLSEL